MNKFGLYLLFFLFITATFGQGPLNLEFNNLTIRKDLKVELNQPSGQLQIRSYGDIWFSLASDLVEIGEIPTGSLFPVSIFPDSTIIWDFDQLSDPQRAVVEQIYIKDRTHEEAAAHLQIPLGTLKSRLRLGVAKLRNLIGVNV